MSIEITVAEDVLLRDSELTPTDEETGAVNARLPEGMRWLPQQGQLVATDDRPYTGADIDWAGLDQELGTESSLVGAVNELRAALGQLD